jgi:MFS family permease
MGKGTNVHHPTHLPNAERTAPARSHTGALVVLCLAQFGIVLAFQGTAITLPDIERGFALPVSASQWLVSANAVAYGGLLLPAGRAGDLFGHRRLFIGGSVLFGCASLMAGLAPNFEWLIVARIIQGVGAACFTPAMFALLADIFPDGSERRRALAAWGTAGPLGGVIAILAGGALASAVGWRAMFLLGALLVIPVVVLALTVLPVGQVRRRERLSLVATVTGTLGIGAIVYGLGVLANVQDVTLQSVGWLVLGFTLVGVCIGSERRAAFPLVAPSLRGRWVVWQPIAVSLFHGASINTPIVFYGLFMQQFRDATPWEIGLGFLPCNVAIMAASASSSRLAQRIGFRWVMVVGMALVILGLLVLTSIAPDRSYLVTILPGWLIFGLGVGASQVGIVGTATERAPEADRGVVGGLVSTFAQIGTAVGLALLVIVSGWFPSDIAGYRAAFAAGSGLALLGLVLAMASGRRQA